jgi:MtN3 and saliva related transmembrane protein
VPGGERHISRSPFHNYTDLLKGGSMTALTIFELLGITGSLIICASIIPQVIKTYRTKSARDLSITYLMTLMIGIILLTIYSIYVRDLVYIFGNTLSLLSIALLMMLWKRYCGFR